MTPMTDIILPLIIGLIILLVACIYLFLKNNKLSADINLLEDRQFESTLQASKVLATYKSKLVDQELQFQSRIQKATEESLNKSRSVMRGQATEHLAPFIMQGFNPKDYRFMANPIDYLVFDGLSDLLDGREREITIYLLDIKTGSSQMNKSQRRIRDALIEGRIKFAVFNADTTEYRVWERESNENKDTCKSAPHTR